MSSSTAIQDRLVVFFGCMFSGKTKEAIRQLRQLHERGLAVAFFRPIIDDRQEDPTFIVSHDGDVLRGVAATVVPLDDFDLVRSFSLRADVVCFEEAQFFSLEIVSVIRELLALNKQVYCIVLDRDFKDQPFETTEALMGMTEATCIECTRAFCSVCGEPATITQKKNLNGGLALRTSDRIVVGTEMYEPRCRKCYVLPEV